MSEPTVWGVVLAGGVGSRFWPLSTPARPKQLLPLATAEPMLRDTLLRFAPLIDVSRTLVLTSSALVAAVLAHEPALPPENVLAEPKPAGTTAALAFAASEIARRGGPEAIMVCVHADWSVADADKFRATLQLAIHIALRERSLVTVGIVPTRPDPGFGYIEPDRDDSVDGAWRVARFVEKPDRARAAEMVASGNLWNSGIFVWRATDFLEQIAELTPEVAPALRELDGKTDSAERFFARAQSIPVDIGVLERSDRVRVLPGDFGWDDVGTWASLHRVRTRDRNGNVAHGQVHALDADNNVVHAEEGSVVLYGVNDLVVVTRPGLTFVTTRDRAADLKTLVESLPPEVASAVQ